MSWKLPSGELLMLSFVQVWQTREWAQAAALQSVAVRRSTSNFISNHYFHHHFIIFFSSSTFPVITFPHRRTDWIKLRPASRNIVRHHGSESHNHPPPTPQWFSRLCLKSCLLYTYAHAQCHVHFFPSRGILFPVKTADGISGLGSVWLSRWGVIKNYFR